MPTNCIFNIDGYLGLGTTIPGYGDKLRIKATGTNVLQTVWIENYCTQQALILGNYNGYAWIGTDYADASGDHPLLIKTWTGACMIYQTGANAIGINTGTPNSYGTFAIRAGICLNQKNVSLSTSDAINSTFDVRHPGPSIVDLSSQNSDLTFSTNPTTTDGTERMRITSGGNIGINTCTPGSYKLYVNGSFYSAGSSCEYKTQICQYNTDSCMFMKLKPVTYQYKDEY